MTVVAAAGAGMTWEMKRAARDQIFSSSGAFQRLYSELFASGEDGPDVRLPRGAADHDVHEWGSCGFRRRRLTFFRPTAPGSACATIASFWRR